MKAALKISVLAMVFAFALALPACGGNNGGGSNGSSGGEAAGQSAAPAAQDASSQVVGTWDFTGVIDAQGNAISLSDFAAATGTDISLLQTVYVFNGDGTATVSNMSTGLIEGTWTLSGDQLSVTASYQGEESVYVLTLGADTSGAPVLTSPNPDGSTTVFTKVS